MKSYFLLLFLLLSMAALAQPKQNSPYSRYGLGDFFPQYFAQHSGMAGLTAAINDPFQLNLMNPASLSHLRATAFETGLYAKNSQFKTGTETANTWSGNLNHLALGFTLKSPINEALDRKQTPWQVGMGIGLQPMQLVGYSIQTVSNLPDLGLVSNEFEGTGGNYQLNYGVGVKYKRTSMGAKIGWNFGKSAFENTTSFRDSIFVSTNHFENNFRDEVRLSGLQMTLGAQHDFVLKFDPNNKKLPTEWVTVGATYGLPHQYNATGTILRLRSRGKLGNGTYLNADTLTYLANQKTKIQMPSTFGFGVTYVKANRLKIGVQADFASWSNYKNALRPFAMRNTMNLAAGVEIIPDIISYNKYLRRVRYRFGGYYRQDPRLIDGKELNDVGLSVGLGLPLVLPRQGTSFVNAAIELGQMGRGTTIQENYLRLQLGFTLNDNSWFYKRRFE